MAHRPFASFANRFTGQTCWDIGRGPTRFDYGQRRMAVDPVLFITVAVTLSDLLPSGLPCFWFAHDANQRVYLTPRLRPVAVLPEDAPEGKVLCRPDDPILNEIPAYTLYPWGSPGEARACLDADRKALARLRLFHWHSGTIHSLLHFVWYLGCRGARLVGCDEINQRFVMYGLNTPANGAYDVRRANRSGSISHWTYDVIRNHQEAMLGRLSLEADYVGMPRRRAMEGQT